MKALVHRLLSRDERTLLREGWQTLTPFVLDYSDETRRRRYFHLYQQTRSSDILSTALHLRFTDFASRLCQELTASTLIESGDEMTHYGYLVSAPGAPAQDWHIDYDGDMVSVYIPLTRETERNATQYLQQGDGYCLSVQFINQSENRIPIIYNPRHDVHRGIDNSEWFTRTVFYFYISKPHWQSAEPLFERATKLSVNIDATERSARYCPEEDESLEK